MPTMAAPPAPVTDRSGCAAEKHGTSSAYNHQGCRCPDASEADRLLRKRRRHGRLPEFVVPSIGTHRRIRALQALGWPMYEIARRIGYRDARSLGELMTRDTISRPVAGRVAAVYDELCMTVGPSRLTRLRAATAGYPGPLAWDDIDHDETPNAGATVRVMSHDDLDWVKVDRCCDGRLPSQSLTIAERAAVIDRLLARGMSAAAIEDRTGIADRTTERRRSALLAVAA